MGATLNLRPVLFAACMLLALSRPASAAPAPTLHPLPDGGRILRQAETLHDIPIDGRAQTYRFDDRGQIRWSAGAVTPMDYVLDKTPVLTADEALNLASAYTVRPLDPGQTATLVYRPIG